MHALTLRSCVDTGQEAGGQGRVVLGDPPEPQDWPPQPGPTPLLGAAPPGFPQRMSSCSGLDYDLDLASRWAQELYSWGFSDQVWRADGTQPGLAGGLVLGRVWLRRKLAEGRRTEAESCQDTWFQSHLTLEQLLPGLLTGMNHSTEAQPQSLSFTSLQILTHQSWMIRAEPTARHIPTAA